MSDQRVEELEPFCTAIFSPPPQTWEEGRRAVFGGTSKMAAGFGLSGFFFPDLENFVTTVFYHFCLNLAEKFSQPGDNFFPSPVQREGGGCCMLK